MPSSDGWDFTGNDGSELPAAPRPSAHQQAVHRELPGVTDPVYIVEDQQSSDEQFLLAHENAFSDVVR